MSDKQTERRRYDDVARLLLEARPSIAVGSAAIAPIHRSPYLCYERRIAELVRPDHRVLELGAGTGVHTIALAEAGAHVVATDISATSLRVLTRLARGRGIDTVDIVAADMAALPFMSESFDVVACAGSLSYGEPDVVDAEIRRVLRRGGTFLCVDSLNHNPVYRLNRWLRYRRGQRTLNTLRCMPTEQRIAALCAAFESSSVRYFGAVAYLLPMLGVLVGQRRAARASDALDRLLGVGRSAFKFVLVARRRR